MSSADLSRRLDFLEARLARAERELSMRPVKPSKGSASVKNYVLTVTGGNTLTTGQTGVKYSSSQITDVPSAYDPNVTSAFIDGVGRGTLRIDNVAQSGFYLFINDTVGTIARPLVAGDIVILLPQTRTLTVGGDPNTTVTAYTAFWF